ncbi:MAG: glutamate synthase large subunit [Polyangiaceae bacterium]
MPLPPRHGLYDPAFEHDACGLGFVADLNRAPSHDVVAKALEVLRRLSHRGAAGSDPDTGDGCGILLPVPHAFFERELAREDHDLPNAGDYGVAMCFLARDPKVCEKQMGVLEATVRHFGQKVLAWRDVPVDETVLGPLGRASRPSIRQLFIGRMCPVASFERVLFMIRKRAGKLASAFGDSFYVASCSSRTIVYKGLMLPSRLAGFFLDLDADDVRASLALVHSRFSTNTFPTWERAHPYRRIAHNGEINTLRGNQNWMSAREANLESRVFGEYIDEFKPIIRPGGSDSASLDNVVDFLVAGGRSLPHVMMMLVPEVWATAEDMDPAKRAFYEYHASLVEPWDGPAALVFTDGVQIGAMLDRNGLRPAKYVVTKGGLVVLASEFGVVDVGAEDVVEKGRIQPGRMFLVDTAKGRIVPDAEIKAKVAGQSPYGAWIRDNKVSLSDLADGNVSHVRTMGTADRERLERAFGTTREDVRVVLGPMATKGEEPVGSMGIDSPLAVLSSRPQSLFRYFKQQFAQVTNPPIDPIREELVMSLACSVGAEGNLLDEGPRQARLLELEHPLLTNDDLARIRGCTLEGLEATVLPTVFPKRGDPRDALHAALENLAAEAARAIDVGYGILVLSDRSVDEDKVAIPALLAVSAVHQSLVSAKKRVRVGIVAETAEAREVADVALLVGYGASAVNPYLAFESIAARVASKEWDGTVDAKTAEKNYVKAHKKGLLKILSKMGISTIASYHGAQIFEAVGIANDVVEPYFRGTASRIGGIGLREIALEARARHDEGFGTNPRSDLDVGGVYAWRRDGEVHLWSPTSVGSLQKAVRLEDARSYAEYSAAIHAPSNPPVTLRALWDFDTSAESVPLDEVEPAARIVRRFATGAMSFGSISKEAHENLAIAMNRIGAKSNTGEGGEDPARFVPDANGDLRRSAIKQVASARFGVTAHYLVNADEIQIKVAQGAKPGEGGQLPGPKVDEIIARVRNSTPGVTLISPPPHHDIYSIEDLAQLIFDLKNVNPRAKVSVKLVSEAGVGTIAAGVAKAHADAILIAGHDGGTGASPLSSVHHAGTPWELGLKEAQDVLVMNGLRSRVRLQTDGQLKTGRDVAFAALLGAEEFGFSTAPLVASGCIMMRKCHLNTCPVGVATQDPVLRARFRGQPEHVVNYFFFVAEELRAIMAKLGFRTVDAMVGQVDRIRVRAGVVHPKAKLLDFSDVLARSTPEGAELRHVPEADRGEGVTVDRTLVLRAKASLEKREPTRIELPIHNVDRAFGANLGGEIARRFGAEGLPRETITVVARGTAGQSFGAFATSGMTLILEGEANDYVGKGLSGGILAVRPPRAATFVADANVIVGNTVLYGAVRGSAFFAGRAGERFAVRMSGGVAVVEGVGDHGCEYMTGGTVIVLGETGRNFAAGMSGGVAYVFDESATFGRRVNPAMVDLEPLSEDEDVNLVRSLLEEHRARTGSVKADRILAAFAEEKARFVKVFPTEYRRVLAARRKAAGGAS